MVALDMLGVLGVAVSPAVACAVPVIRMLNITKDAKSSVYRLLPPDRFTPLPNRLSDLTTANLQKGLLSYNIYILLCAASLQKHI